MLIVVTGDHETGGLTIGFATTAYNTHFDYLFTQNVSYKDFDKEIPKMGEEGKTFEEALEIIKNCCGLTTEEGRLPLTADETKRLNSAYVQSMLPYNQRALGADAAFLYGGYEPLTVTCLHILNNKAGLCYTSYAHTGLQLHVYAYGAHAEDFVGSYDNADIFFKLMGAMGLAPEGK